MSRVTDIILILPCFDRGIEKVQEWLVETGHPKLVRIDKHAGGDKNMQADLYAAAINYFGDVGKFIAAMQKLPWAQPENVQLLVQTEDDERFTMYSMKG